MWDKNVGTDKLIKVNYLLKCTHGYLDIHIISI